MLVLCECVCQYIFCVFRALSNERFRASPIGRTRTAPTLARKQSETVQNGPKRSTHRLSRLRMPEIDCEVGQQGSRPTNQLQKSCTGVACMRGPSGKEGLGDVVSEGAGVLGSCDAQSDLRCCVQSDKGVWLHPKLGSNVPSGGLMCLKLWSGHLTKHD